MRKLFWQPLFAAVLLVLGGCDQSDDEKITVYRAPKEADAPAVGNEPAGVGTVHWTAPSNWEEQPATGVRKGSFLVRAADGKQADVSVISFPESAGGLLANVNRWRNQLKLAPIANEAEAGTTLSANGHDIFFVDVVSAEPMDAGSKTRILGGIFPLEGETWFFKMMGPDELVQTQRDAFREFLQSVHVAEVTAPPHPPMSANSGGSTNAPTASLPGAETAPIHYTLPPDWQEKPLSPMRVASFAAGAADVSVVSLAGAAGGDLANVNRWRGQLNLPPIDENALRQSAEHVKANGREYLMVDLVSEGPGGEAREKQRILAAILNEKDRAWFVKMTGPDEVVAAQKNAFVDFLRSLQLP